MLKIGIVAHTARATQARQLSDTVKAAFISIDNGLMGCDTNHRTVQQHLAEYPSTWSVILEDDAEPVEGFREQLHSALLMAPTPVVSLYLGRKRPPHWQKRIATALTEAQHQDACWVMSTHLLHAVGYAIKTELLPSLLTHTSTLPSDQHIGEWCRRFGHLISYTVPSLIDHQDGPTIVDHPDGDPRRPGRKAWTVGTRHQWTTTAVLLTPGRQHALHHHP